MLLRPPDAPEPVKNRRRGRLGGGPSRKPFPEGQSGPAPSPPRPAPTTGRFASAAAHGKYGRSKGWAQGLASTAW